MFGDFISGFAEYLNSQDYSISTSKVNELFRLIEDTEADVTDQTMLISLIRIAWCMNPQEREALPEHFKSYVKERDRLILDAKQKKDLKEQLARKQQEYDEAQNDFLTKRAKSMNRQQEIREQMHEVQAERAAAEEVAREEFRLTSHHVTATDQKFIEKNRKKIEKLKDEAMREFLLDGKALKKPDYLKKKKALFEQAKTAMVKGKKDEFKLLTGLFDILNRAEKNFGNEKALEDKYVAEAVKEYTQQERSLQSAIDAEEAKIAKVQAEISKKLAELKRVEAASKTSSKAKVKDQSKNHRAEFIAGGGAVQTRFDAPECIDKPFKKLTENEKREIEQYIRANILKFKTRLTRFVSSLERTTVDMQRTIQNACRTGGLPMEIYHTQKRPGKTDLILVLDVSGSCKDAASMMLTFMYLLQEAFPRGCKAYAFTNVLYDISEMMQADDVDAAIKTVLSSIPRSGAYSDYNRPLTSLWRDHRDIFKKDSIVLFMGDARNNQNDPSYENLKGICRRVRKAYWLNSEPKEEWDTADSIASGYARYAPMMETLSAADLVYFVNEVLA